MPCGVLGGPPCGGHGVPQKVLRNAKVSCEVVLDEGVRRTHPLGWGETEARCVRISWSDRWN